jgi:MerR family transcriptional regulator, light-induced transcriptional regulator
MALDRGWDRGLGPRALVACPAEEQPTFGLISFGIALHEIGWRITYLGADTPIPMIVEAAAAVQPCLTTVSASMPERLEPVLHERAHLAAHWRLAIAGEGTSAELAARCGSIHLSADPITPAKSIFE